MTPRTRLLPGHPVATTALLLVGLVAAVRPAPAHGQALVEEIRGLAEDNAGLYVRPLAQGLSFAMAGGIFEGADPLGRFGFDVGIRATGAFPSVAAETFSPVLPESVQWQDQVFEQPFVVSGTADGRSPTAVGEGPGAVLEPSGPYRDALEGGGYDPADYAIPLPDGLEIPLVPYAILHGSVGVGLGTELSARFIPDVRLDDEVGSLGARGFAVRHSLAYWIPLVVDVSAIFATQRVDVGDYLEASSTQYGGMVGGAMGPLSLYGSAVLRRSSAEIGYTVENPGDTNPALPADGTRIAIDGDIDSRVAYGVGAQLSLLLLNLSAHYTADDFDLLTLKVGIGIP